MIKTVLPNLHAVTIARDIYITVIACTNIAIGGEKFTLCIGTTTQHRISQIATLEYNKAITVRKCEFYGVYMH